MLLSEKKPDLLESSKIQKGVLCLVKVERNIQLSLYSVMSVWYVHHTPYIYNQKYSIFVEPKNELQIALTRLLIFKQDLKKIGSFKEN